MTLEECKNYLSLAIKELENETPENSIPILREKFSEAKEILKYENNYIYVVVDSPLSKVMIEKFYSNRLNEIVTSLVGTKTGFKFINKDEAEKEKSLENEKFSIPDVEKFDSSRSLRPEYTFDNFVIGETNRFAYLTAMKVAESPGVLNPLYIFGDVGLGKTHLMIAIGHYILDKNINAKILYTTAQQFVEDVFQYTKRETQNIDVFYNKYRNVDVLLIDDIQMLAEKTKSQEEFFKIFDYLHEKNKQIVVTSDRNANELNLMKRLISRFTWGIPVDIQLPDENLRLSILKRKLEGLLNNPSDVPEECLRLISNNFKNSVRELEGALRRFVTYCVTMNIPFTIENVDVALGRILVQSQSNSSEDSKISTLTDVVANYFQINKSDLFSESRKPILVYARNLCYYIIKKDYNISFTKIADYFGKKDHTSISYGYERVKEGLVNDQSYKNDIQYIKDKLK